MVHPSHLAVLVLLVPAVAGAEVYRCEEQGAVVYTDRPCASQSRPHRLPPAVVVDGGDGAEALAQDYDARLRRKRQERDKADAQWLKDHEARRRHEARVRKAMLDGRIVAGMTAEQVRSVLGEPLEITRQERDGVMKERWLYRNAGIARSVNFKDGRVTSSASRSREKK